MAFKFFNIGKANEEIIRLETRNAELEAENKSFQENDSAVAAEAAKQRTELEAAQASIKRLETEKAAADAKVVQLETDVKTAQTSADKLASAKALEITAAQGQKPIDVGAGAGTAAGDIVKQYQGITDSTDKVLFYRKHKDAIDAAWRATPPTTA